MANGVATRLRTRAKGRSAGFDVDFSSGAGRGPRLRRLPAGSRAAVGGLLVAVAAVGLFAAALGAGSAAESYVVARRSLAPGARLAADDLRTQPLALPDPQRRRAFEDPAALVGAVVLAPLEPGELVQASAVADGRAAVDAQELSFRVDTAMVGDLRPGERIDVLGTFGSGADAITAVVARHAAITGVDRAPALVTDGSTVLTVALESDEDALALAHGVALAKLAVVRSGPASSASTDASPYRGPAASAAPGTATREQSRSTARPPR